MTTPVPEKPARRMSEIPPAVLKQLNQGKRETGNLVEWLAVDQGLLMSNVFPEIGLGEHVASIQNVIRSLKTPTATKQTSAIGKTLAELHQGKKGISPALGAMSSHPSDVVRTWAAGWIGYSSKLTLKQKLKQIKTFASDSHFGVREMAWMAVREDIIEQLDEALSLLEPWSHDKEAGVRRFASEATRPCGVWCRHITRLKQEPEIALPILEPLKGDDSKYVRDSVANWLNDAGKSQPKWVKEVCRRWEVESEQSSNTALILKRAMRNLK